MSKGSLKFKNKIISLTSQTIVLVIFCIILYFFVNIFSYIKKSIFKVISPKKASIEEVKHVLPGTYLCKTFIGNRDVWVKIKITNDFVYYIWEESPSSGKWGNFDYSGRITEFENKRWADNGKSYVCVSLNYLFGSTFQITYKNENDYDSPSLWINSEALGEMNRDEDDPWK